MLNRISKSFSAYKRNIQGGTAVAFALSVLPIMVGIGVAVDMSHLNNARNEMQDGLDAGVLAGTLSLVETGGNEAKALQAAKAAYEGALKGKIAIIDSSIKFKLNEKKNGVKATGNAYLKMELMQLVGIKRMPVVQDANAEGQINAGGVGADLEVALMFDITGSMCSNGTGPCTNGTKLSGAKTAANNLIDAVIWPDQSVNTSKISIIPFNHLVRVGPNGGGGAVMKALTNLDPTWSGYYRTCTSGGASGASGENGGGWECYTYETNLVNYKIQPCVTDRHYTGADDFDYTDNLPVSNNWMNGRGGERYPLSQDSTDTPVTSGTGSSAADPVININYEQIGDCWASVAANEMMPLSNSKASLKAKINSLEAFGPTGGALGTAMSWFTLSPNFASVWPSGAAKSYSLMSASPKKLRKVAIMMSDGGYNSYRGWIDPSRIAEISTAAVTTCNAMKAKGIEIFTVGYDLDNLTSAEAAYATNTLKACGTDISHFYSSLNATQLATAFNAIGKAISGSSSGSVRLVQ